MTKKWWQSKTLWINVLVALAALLSPIRDFFVQMGWSPEVVVTILAAVNGILRLITGKPIEKRIL
jgi:hypothetical protein